MREYILVPLDGSVQAESALRLAVTLARLTSSGIALLRAVPAQQCDVGYSKEMAAARDYLHTIARVLEDVGVPVCTEIMESLPAPAIVEYANNNRDVWLIAIASRAQPSGSWCLGSILEMVLRTSHQPVLVVRPETGAEGQDFPLGNPGVSPGLPQQAFSPEGRRGSGREGEGEGERMGERVPAGTALRKIIVPLDESNLGEEALEYARHLALLTGATLALVSAVPPPADTEIDQVELVRLSVEIARTNEAARLARYLANTAAQLRARGVQVETELVYGHPAEMTLLAARRLQGDLIVMAMAAPERGELERLWLGNVARKLVQISTLPILIVRAGLEAIRGPRDCTEGGGRLSLRQGFPLAKLSAIS
jgi:nucleotide-binding universal stress UspA family protein